MGVKLLIDDFGTGYSSLSYLKKLPIHKLKIDKSFITDLAGDKDDQAITNAIVAMAHILKLKVVAEGVETKGQETLLESQDCDEMQGFLFSKPVPAQGIRKIVGLSYNGFGKIPKSDILEISIPRRGEGESMGTSVGVGYSVHRNPEEAGKEAALKALEQKGPGKPDFVFVFATVGYNQQVLIRTIRETTSGAPLSGCSGEGIITQGMVAETNFGVCVMAISSDELRFANVRVKEIAREADLAGERLAAELKPLLARGQHRLLSFYRRSGVRFRPVPGGVRKITSGQATSFVRRIGCRQLGYQKDLPVS